MNSMYTADQINIPVELGTILKHLTKAAIRDAPGVTLATKAAPSSGGASSSSSTQQTAAAKAEVLKWCANYFAGLHNTQMPFDAQGRLMTSDRRSAPGTGAGGASGSRGGAGSGPGGAAVMAADVIEDAANFESVPTGEAGEDDNAEQIVSHLFAQYDQDGSGRITRQELPLLIADLKASLGLDLSDEQAQEFVAMLDANDDGTIDLIEFRQLFFQ